MGKGRDSINKKGMGECCQCFRTLLVRSSGYAPAHGKPKCDGTGRLVLHRRMRDRQPTESGTGQS